MRRLRNLFRADGRTVVVAMDHGTGLEVLPALNDTSAALKGIVAGGADAVLTSYGIATRYEEELTGTGFLLRLDGGNSKLSKNSAGHAVLSPMDALRIGAEGCACMGFPGAENEVETLTQISRFAAEAHALGLPLVAEMLPGGFGPEPAKSVENVRLAARIGAECGADIIKTLFVGSVKEFRTVVEGCFRPLIVLGGEKSADLGALLLLIEQAMEAGAAGVAIGRNVWKHPDPKGVTQALVDIVHGGKKASETGRNL
jgi:fructose-bisphosphate aldolase, class I